MIEIALVSGVASHSLGHNGRGRGRWSQWSSLKAQMMRELGCLGKAVKPDWCRNILTNDRGVKALRGSGSTATTLQKSVQDTHLAHSNELHLRHSKAHL